jgi:hypothetical protein
MILWLSLSFLGLTHRGACQGDENQLYPYNSLTNPGDIYPFGGSLPTPRIRHIVEVIDPFVLIYGGISADNILLDDMNIYDTRFQTWSGPISRLECCNQAEQVIERLGSDSKQPVSTFPLGFEGGIPPARADHGAAVVNNLLFTFGGMSTFGYLNDFFHFNLTELTWTTISRGGSSWPSRRAGHALVSDSQNLYLFGGRTLLADNSLVTLNDLWTFNIQLNSWTNSPPKSTDTPLGRQYAACAIHYNHLWIFGGIDSPTGYTFNDLWSYDLILHQWNQRSSNSGSLYGFLPPPMHHAHLIPAPSSSWHPSTPSFLIFGGLSSGGSCGNTICLPLNRSFYGQVYRFSFTVNDITSSPLMNSVESIFIINRQPVMIGKGSWSYARLSSNNEWGVGGSGKYLKKYALESIGYDRVRGLVYEYGGVEYSPEVESESQSRSSASTNFKLPIAETRTGEGPDIYESGGRLTKDYSDLSTGEQLRGNVDTPSVPDWWYEEFLELEQRLNPAKVNFRKEFHEYLTRLEDIVLVKETRY